MTLMYCGPVDDDQVLAAHLAGVAARIEELWGAGVLWPGERNVLSDGLLAAAPAGDANLQAQVGELTPCSALTPCICPQQPGTSTVRLAASCVHAW